MLVWENFLAAATVDQKLSVLARDAHGLVAAFVGLLVMVERVKQEDRRFRFKVAQIFIVCGQLLDFVDEVVASSTADADDFYVVLEIFDNQLSTLDIYQTDSEDLQSFVTAVKSLKENLEVTKETFAKTCTK